MNVQIQIVGVKMIINSMNSKIPYLQDSSYNSVMLKSKQNAKSGYESTMRASEGKSNYNEVINSGSNTSESVAATVSFNGKMNNILASDKFGRFLESVDAHNQTANAFVALITAGVIRSGLTMAIPGMKDKKDKIYSTAQAISSGTIGFGVTMALTTPLDDALQATLKDPKKFGAKKTAKLLDDIKNMKADAKSAEELKKLEQQEKTLKLLMKNLPEWIICVPRAMLTIALIPLILKYVFGLEKKPKHAPKEDVQQPTQQEQVKENFSDLKQGKNIAEFANKTEKVNEAKNITFAGNPDAVVETVVNASKKPSAVKKFYNKYIVENIAKYISAPIMDSKLMHSVSDKWKDSDFLFNHVATVTSFVISGTYVKRTLDNKDMEEDKKKVLAVNQGLTFLLSTLLSYTIDGKLEAAWQRLTASFIGNQTSDKDFAQKFKVAQEEVQNKIKTMKANNASKAELKEVRPLKALDYAIKQGVVLKENKKMANMVNGLSVLKKMIVIGSIFRLAVPVFVTPVASILTDKYLEHKRSKEAAQKG